MAATMTVLVMSGGRVGGDVDDNGICKISLLIDNHFLCFFFYNSMRF